MAYYLRQNSRLDSIISKLEMRVECPAHCDGEAFNDSLTARANDILAGEYGIDYAVSRLEAEFPERDSAPLTP